MKTSLFWKKMSIPERISEILGTFVFLNKFKKHEENLNLLKQLFLIKLVKGTNININCFSPQRDPHRAKLCFSVVFKHFFGISLKTSLFCQKFDYLRKKLR